MLKSIVFAVLIGLGGGAVLTYLGVWQLQRLAWKESIIAAINGRIAAEPVALPMMPVKTDDQYLPVRLQGYFSGEGLDVLVSRKQIGPGYRVISVVQTTDGRRVLVDRGFLPEASRKVERPDESAGLVTFYGNLLWPDEVDSYTPKPDQKTGLWFARDLPQMARVLQSEPVLLIERTSSYKDAAIEPLPIDTSLIPNNHLGYALQWFGLALAWVAMTGLFMVKRYKAFRKSDEHQVG